MKWEKRGLIFLPREGGTWSKSHAQIPVVAPIDEKIWRIFYTTRNQYQQSCISYIEVEAGNPQNISYVHERPILEKGAAGTFDDCGTMCACHCEIEKTKYLYYVGWNVRNTVSYHLAIGVAVSENGSSYQKYSIGPVMDRSIEDPYMVNTCSVIKDGAVWKMWYTSGTEWKEIAGKTEPFYLIKYAESQDGIKWRSALAPAICYKHQTEAVGCPRVLKENDKYRMWYSYRDVQGYRTDRSKSYRIGYAESNDGVRWTRLDESVGIDISEKDADWDSQMIAYPYVVRWQGKLYMFYNGNGFGQTGFGYAICEEE